MSWLRSRRRTVDLDNCEKNVDTLNTGVYNVQYDCCEVHNTGDTVVTSAPCIQNIDNGVVTSATCIQNIDNGVVTSAPCIQNIDNGVVTSATCIQDIDNGVVTSAPCIQNIDNDIVTSAACIDSCAEGNANEKDNLIIDKGETSYNIVEDEATDADDVFFENEKRDENTCETKKERHDDTLPQCSHDISATEIENVDNTSIDNVANTSIDNVVNTSTDNVANTSTDNVGGENMKFNDTTSDSFSEQAANLEDDFIEESFKQSVRSIPRLSLDSRLPGLLKSASMLRDSRTSDSSISTISENGDEVGAVRPRKSISWAEDLETVHEFEKLNRRKLSLSALFKKY